MSSIVYDDRTTDRRGSTADLATFGIVLAMAGVALFVLSRRARGGRRPGSRYVDSLA